MMPRNEPANITIVGGVYQCKHGASPEPCRECWPRPLRQEPADSELLKHSIEAAGELEVYARRGELGDWSDPIVRAAVLSIHALFERLSAVLSFCETPDPRGGILGFRAVEDILAIIRGRL